jgi:tetratricopeptide (TPR) repeat protein
LFTGELQTAQDCAEKAAQINAEVGLSIIQPLIDYILSLILLSLGKLEYALERAEEAVRLSKEYQARSFEGFALAILGRIMGEADPSQTDMAQTHIRQAISMAEEINMKPSYAQGHLFLGEVFEIAGRKEDALENLRKAEEMYRDMGVGSNSYWLTRTQEALARLEK